MWLERMTPKILGFGSWLLYFFLAWTSYIFVVYVIFIYVLSYSKDQ